MISDLRFANIMNNETFCQNASTFNIMNIYQETQHVASLLLTFNF